MRARATVSYLAPMWAVNLPSYTMVPATWAPITPKMIDADGVLVGADPVKVLALGPTCVIDFPDDTPIDNQGQIDKERLAAMYGGKWAAPDYVPPVLSAP